MLRAPCVLARALATIILWPTLAASQVSDGEASQEFWPEHWVFVNLTSQTRLYFLGARTNPRNDEFTEGALGAHFDYFAQRNDTELLLRAGYRVARREEATGRKRIENRPLAEFTARRKLGKGWAFGNRNRLELLFVGGDSWWRFRNQAKLEKHVRLGRFEFSINGAAEPFYDSSVEKWNRIQFTAGPMFPIGSRIEVEPRLVRQILTTPERATVNAFGLILKIYLGP